MVLEIFKRAGTLKRHLRVLIKCVDFGLTSFELFQNKKIYFIMIFLHNQSNPLYQRVKSTCHVSSRDDDKNQNYFKKFMNNPF